MINDMIMEASINKIINNSINLAKDVTISATNKLANAIGRKLWLRAAKGKDPNDSTIVPYMDTSLRKAAGLPELTPASYDEVIESIRKVEEYLAEEAADNKRVVAERKILTAAIANGAKQAEQQIAAQLQFDNEAQSNIN